MARQKLELESERAVPKSREVKFWHKLLLWLSAGILLSSVGWHCWERLLHHYKLGVRGLQPSQCFITACILGDLVFFLSSIQLMLLYSPFPELNEGDVQMPVEKLWEGTEHSCRDSETHTDHPPWVGTQCLKGSLWKGSSHPWPGSWSGFFLAFLSLIPGFLRKWWSSALRWMGTYSNSEALSFLNVCGIC